MPAERSHPLSVSSSGAEVQRDGAGSDHCRVSEGRKEERRVTVTALRRRAAAAAAFCSWRPSLFSTAAAITILARSHSDNGHAGSPVISDHGRRHSPPQGSLTRRPPRSVWAISSPPASPFVGGGGVGILCRDPRGSERGRGGRGERGGRQLSRAVQSGVNREYICA